MAVPAMLKIALTDLNVERFYVAGMLFSTMVYMDNVKDWWTWSNLGNMTWRAIAWPYYIPHMMVNGVEQE